jgi:hypothetical protein
MQVFYMKQSDVKKHSLKELQQFMWQAVSRPLTADFEMRQRWIDGTSLNTTAAQFVRANHSMSSFQRLQIYNQQYWYRLLDCLEDDFPGLRAVLGARRFLKLSKEYLKEHSSRSFSLRDLGSELSSFLINRHDLIEPHRELCLELARFEWAQIVAFDGPSLDVVDDAFIRGAGADNLRVAVQPYITLLELSYALDEYSVALSRHHRDRSEAGSEKKLVQGTAEQSSKKKAPWPVQEKTFLVVHRISNTVYFKRLEAPAFVTLSALARGRSLTEAVADAVSYLEERDLDLANLPVDVPKWFSLWVRLGWLCKP